MKQIRSICALGGIAAGLLIAGCGNDNSFSSSSGGRLRLSIRATSGAATKIAGSEVQQVTITSAQVVLSEIELENSNKDSMDFVTGAPMVINLNLAGAMTPVGAVPLPFGTYEKIKLEISRLDSSDGQVYLDNPNLQCRSVYVEGYVDGDSSATFVFSSDLCAKQKQRLSPPLVVDENSPDTNIVLSIDTATWFNARGDGFLDPRSRNNQEDIERNIEASIKMYQDNDNDGKPDDGDDDSDDDHK